ncbi:transducin-like enhancer protein 3-B [Trichonephila inaurata madagascariensis]|uniref:Transducin-like enhancer protein 3-B n=1 Tax=Trichonephila inaurata madagascariensis TaxID=2747483 RepID=A0A8X6ML34_9ARAC|nr:transducin-like enhancer protein 3-B [Trichonephila inaurata madagascariensis]
MYPARHPGPPPQAGQPFKFTVAESCDRIKEEFSFLQAQYHKIPLFCSLPINIDRKCVCRWSQEVYSENTSPRQPPLESARPILLNTPDDSRVRPSSGVGEQLVVFWHHWLGLGNGFVQSDHFVPFSAIRLLFLVWFACLFYCVMSRF